MEEALPARVHTLSVMAAEKQTVNASFVFSFFLKDKILFGFPVVSENRSQCRSYIKAKWHISTLEAGDTCILFSKL